VLVWSYYYMDSEDSYTLLFYLISSFIVSMSIFIISGSLISLFVGWDLLGFTSLFLIFWYRSRAALSSGLLTGLRNRFGDVAFLVIFGLVGASSISIAGTIFLLLLVSFTKSAQFPFRAWLPAAISAPTPVSALVHSSTLVTAGVFLLLRHLSTLPPLLTYAGIITIFLGGYTALFSCDLKKIVAFSTLSQLGLIMLSFSFGSKGAVLMHLLCHGPFKALLFLCVGTSIHSRYGSQETRSSLNLCSARGLTTVLGSVSLLSLRGLPFLAGGVSKHALFAVSSGSCTPLTILVSFLLGVVLTAAYCAKFLFLWLSPSEPAMSPLVPLPLTVLVPLSCLCLLSIVLGCHISIYLGFGALCISILDSSILLFCLILGGVLGRLASWSHSSPYAHFYDLEVTTKSIAFRYKMRTSLTYSEESLFSLNHLHLVASALSKVRSSSHLHIMILFCCLVML